MKHHHAQLIIPIVVILIAFIALGFYLYTNQFQQSEPQAITSFEECAAAGNPIMESYPRQCAADGQTFVENIETSQTQPGDIRVTTPASRAAISSPLVVMGEARGTWFHEATFPVTLTNWDGLIIAEGYATAQGEWMTTEFVPFTSTITFTKPSFDNRGYLILKKANASGLPEHDASVEIPVYFEGVASTLPSAPSMPSGGVSGSAGGNMQPSPAPSAPVACTMEAMLCPDGSYVGRQGPKCEFAPCPGN